MNFRYVINTVNGYFAHLGNQIYEIRMGKPDKMFRLEDLNKVFEGYTITESGMKAHKWVRRRIERCVELSIFGIKEYGKRWGHPIGTGVIQTYREINENEYRKDLIFRWYPKKMKIWEEHMALAEAEGRTDDVQYCMRKLEAYAHTFAANEIIQSFVHKEWWVRYINKLHPLNYKNVSDELKKIKW